ncbi:MAG: hypothetical protein EON59_06250 [Alphaproteobacteria bacterium]|nr:MAG: hypothetical protein EON59_06250 [Alphaproteobacteria bacterium]
MEALDGVKQRLDAAFGQFGRDGARQADGDLDLDAEPATRRQVNGRAAGGDERAVDRGRVRDWTCWASSKSRPTKGSPFNLTAVSRLAAASARQ